MFNFFKKKVEKEEFDRLKEGVQTGFNSVKHNMSEVSKWIGHLDSEKGALKEEINEIHDELVTIIEELENLKNIVSIVGNKGVFKQRQTVFNKQTSVVGVLNSVQTGVQTVFLDKLSTTERAFIPNKLKEILLKTQKISKVRKK